ncbi:MAG TPA: hypothetical protein VFM88_19485 [Vicinamibacteria bacterium]|nr:hypothetical protein [Vicinamibacteria bacterium]
MMTETVPTSTERYGRCVAASRRVRWEIDADVIRGRAFDLDSAFLPDGLSLVHEVPFLDREARRFLSQIQGRTYANMFGLVERFINAKVLELSRDHWLGDQVALEALVRFSDEELKHQELFRRVERLAAEGMPAGYRFDADPDQVAAAVLASSTWAVLALTLHIELFTQEHYRQSIAPQADLSPLFKDVFLFHWKEESQHAILDELELRREDARLSAAERDRAVDDLIALVGAVDGILQAQAGADAVYFVAASDRSFTTAQVDALHALVLKAYRWQYVVSGVQGRFVAVLKELLTESQMARIVSALTPLISQATPAAA